VLFIVLELLQLAAVAVAITRSQAAPQPQAATQTAAPLIAHGQIFAGAADACWNAGVVVWYSN
jgi:hypothetical protein